MSDLSDCFGPCEQPTPEDLAEHDRIVVPDQLHPYDDPPKRDTLPSAPRDLLLEAIAAELGIDRVTGKPPIPELLEALTEGVRARIRVSQQRPAAYAGEPWRTINAEEHARHARNHSSDTYGGTTVDQAGPSAFDSKGDGDLHAAHAALRLDFYLWKVKHAVV